MNCFRGNRWSKLCDATCFWIFNLRPFTWQKNKNKKTIRSLVKMLLPYLALCFFVMRRLIVVIYKGSGKQNFASNTKAVAFLCFALRCIVLRCVLLCCIVLCCTVLYCTVLHCIALHFIVLYCIALHCIVMYVLALQKPLR